MPGEPSAIFDTAELVRACICEAMDAGMEEGVYPGCPCLTYVSPGAPAFDNCCDDCASGDSQGQLVVFVADVFESDNFPVATQTIHPCAAKTLVAQVVVSVTRCAPTMNEAGEAPDAAAIERSAAMIYRDLYYVMQGLRCCVPEDAPPGKRKRRVTLQSIGNVTAQTEGGCAAIEVRAAVEVGVVCGCPVSS